MKRRRTRDARPALEFNQEGVETQLMRPKKVVPIKQEPTWQEWVSAGEAAAKRSPDPVGLSGAGADTGLLHEAISNQAYSYWEARGYPDGSAEQDWLRAEAEIRRRGIAALPNR